MGVEGKGGELEEIALTSVEWVALEWQKVS
jgi:hypothetical protein